MGERRVRRLVEVAPGAERARRFVPVGFKDARWIVGVLLLALGIIGTLRVIGSFDDSVTVWSARTTLVPGQRIAASDLVRTQVRIDDGATRYVTASAVPAGVVQRPVAVGELLPRSAVGAASDVTVRAVTATLDRGQADVIRAGADVEVWVASKREGAGTTGFEPPQQVVDRALVSHVGARAGGVVAVADGQPVEILVPRESLARMIDAVNSGSRITLVPLVGGASS